MSHNKGNKGKRRPRQVARKKSPGLQTVKGEMDGRSLFLTDEPRLKQGNIVQVVHPLTGPVPGRNIEITSRSGPCGNWGRFKFGYECRPA